MGHLIVSLSQDAEAKLNVIDYQYQKRCNKSHSTVSGVPAQITSVLATPAQPGPVPCSSARAGEIHVAHVVIDGVVDLPRTREINPSF